MTSGTIRKGKVELEENDLPEGTKVIVLAREGDGTFELSPDEEAKLLAAIAEGARGEVRDAEEVLRKIRRK